jgi:hypothetical protein
MNEEVLHIVNQNMYVVIHISKGIYHVVSFRITQTSGIKDSSHFVKICLFGAGCRIKLKGWLGKQNTIPNKETNSCLNCDFFDFYDYTANRLDLIKLNLSGKRQCVRKASTKKRV